MLKWINMWINNNNFWLNYNIESHNTVSVYAYLLKNDLVLYILMN